MKIRIALATLAAVVGVTAVSAQGDPIAARRAAMKAVGDQNRVATEMIEGKTPFNADAAKKVLATFADSATRLPGLFPAGSQAGDTNALPAIWQNKADFDAKLKKFADDARASAARVTSVDTLKTEMAEVRKNCGGCHNTYRKRQS